MEAGPGSRNQVQYQSGDIVDIHTRATTIHRIGKSKPDPIGRRSSTCLRPHCTVSRFCICLIHTLKVHSSLSSRFTVSGVGVQGFLRSGVRARRADRTGAPLMWISRTRFRALVIWFTREFGGCSQPMPDGVSTDGLSSEPLWRCCTLSGRAFCCKSVQFSIFSCIFCVPANLSSSLNISACIIRVHIVRGWW